MSLHRRALFLLGLFVAVSCSDAGNPLEPGPRPQPEPDGVLQALQCSVNIQTSSMDCAPREPDAGSAQAAQLITGGQRKYVVLTASNFATGANSLEFDVTVQNLMRQALGTEDGTTLDSAGVRVWYASEPANADVAMMDGTGMLLGGPTPYFQYDTILRTDETSDPKRWRFENISPGATNVQFFVYVVAQIQYPNGWVEVTPPLDTLAPGEMVDLNGIAYAAQADSAPAVSQTLTWSSSNPDVASVDNGTGVVTADSAGTVTITASNGTQTGTATIVVNSDPLFVVDSIGALTNVTVPEPAPGLLEGASDGDAGQTVSVVPGTVTTVRGGTAWLNADGSFEYLSRSGYAGRDTIPFEITDGVTTRDAYAIVDVDPSTYWYVQAGGTGDGRDQFPFGSMAQAQDSAGAGDSILVLTNGVTQVDGPVTLEADQAILGEGIPASITRTVNGQLLTILNGGGSAPGLTNSAAGATVTLGTDNIIRGLGITATSGAAIASQPAGFGTLTVSEVGASATGPVLDLNDGALSAVFTTLTSTGSTGAGLSLENVTGSLTSTGGAISGSTGTAVEVSGGSVGVTYGGDVTKGSAGLLLAVSGGHTGTLAFNGTLSATAGSGISFNDADGTYSFNGTTTLSGGPSVALGNGSDGVFTFGAGTGITNSTGTAFDVNGSTPTVTYSGDISQGNNVLLVSVAEQAADSVIFQTGTLSATSGEGILLSNADGIVRFNGTTTLDGGDAGVDIISGSDGIISFGAGTTIDNVTGTGLEVFESAPTLTFAGSITTSAGSPVVVDGASPCGTVTVSGAVSSTGQGILVQDCSAGSVSFTGAKTLNTGANAALTLTNNTGTAAVSLTGGALSITTSTGAGILGNGAGGFGSLTVSNATVSATNGPALNLTNGTLNATFGSLTSSNSATSGVSLTTVNGTLNTSGGSISGAAGTAFAVSGGNLGGTIATSISQANNASTLAVAGGHNTGTLTFSAAVSATNGNGLQFTDADGTYTFTGNFTLDGAGDEGIDMGASSTGTVNVTPSGGNTAAINSPSGIAISIAGGSLNYSGNVTQASNAALLSVTGGVGGHTGTVAFTSGTLNASNGSGLQFDNADGVYDFDGTVTLNGGDAGIDVTNGSDGTFTFPGTATITSPSTGNLISILNSVSPFSFTYSGGLTKANNNVTGILISNNSGSTITFDGDATTADGDPADVARSISSGTAAAVNLSSNSGSTINFNGGGLNLTTTSGAGFTATGGGTVNVTGAGNQVNSTGGGTAVNIQNTTIGGSGVSFYRVDATGGGTNGIVLSSTGAGGFQVTGDGASDPANTTRGRTTARSGGGTIVLGSGGTISGKSGDAVSLSTTGAVILRNLVISSNSGDGVQATTSAGVTIDNARITGHTDNSALFFTSVSAPVIIHSEMENNAFGAGAPGGDIHNVRLISNTGTGSVESSIIANTSAGAERQLQIFSTTGTLSITVTNNRIGGSTVGDGVGVYAYGTSSITANFQNDSIHNNSSFGIDSGTQTTASGSLNITVNNTALRNNSLGVAVAHGSSGTNTFSITNNNFQTNVANSVMAININRLGSGSFNSFGLFTGTISGNTIGTAATANSGSDTGSGIEVESNGSGGITRVAIVNNTIRQVATHGIYVAAVDANIGGTAAPLVEARIASNSIANLEATALDGIHVLPGALSTDDVTVCVDIANNNSTGIRNGLRVRPSGLPAAPATIQLEGWDGVTARSTYFTARPNTLSGGVAAYAEGTPSAPGGFVAVANCNTP